MLNDEDFEKLAQGIVDVLEKEWGYSGLSGTMYGDFAIEVARRIRKEDVGNVPTA